MARESRRSPSPEPAARSETDRENGGRARSCSDSCDLAGRGSWVLFAQGAERAMVRDVAMASHGGEGRTAEDAGKERGKGRNLREMILTTGTSLGAQAGNKKRAHRRGRRGRRG